MTARQRIIPVRRDYNRWVANQTLEDYALRFTAKSARQYSPSRISQTAIGAISFLALEAVGGAITLSYGTTNAIFAIIAASILLLLIGIPISRYAIRHGVDIDLLTRGAGFGYLGSTVTSLIYASFTFILFAIEASIMTGALELAFGIPLWLGYIISAVAVIPLVTHGVRLISRFQLLTQPIWIVLNILPFIFIATSDWSKIQFWLGFAGKGHQSGELGTIAPFDLAMFGAASAVILALMAQIGEQVDFLRFLPADKKPQSLNQRIMRFLAGPGWVVVGAPKLLAGSFLVVLALSSGIPANLAADPAHMYVTAFSYMVPNHMLALALTAAFVVVSQLKINVMNAYAGSLAWSNFFSRLTHSHPGRVVWLFFNVAIALLLMELGIYKLLEETLGVFSIVASAWLCAISADLCINKPLGLAPPGIEFKRAHLYDINPVGFGGMAITVAVALATHFGLFGTYAASLAIYLVPVLAFTVVPAIAWATGGKYYLARKPRNQWKDLASITCSICEHPFEPEDMAWCPAYAAPICSLCCSLDSRCHDLCKPKARLQYQATEVARSFLPEAAIEKLGTRVGRYSVIMALALLGIGAILWMIALRAGSVSPETATVVNATVLLVFFVFAVMTGIAVWFFVLAHDSRVVAEEESSRQNTLLLREITAHKKTDAALQHAKETAEAANRAKSRYVVGLTHELRTPLNAVLGYAQLLDRDEAIPDSKRSAIRVIKRSADHLSGLIDGLLDISKIEAGRLQVYSNELNLQDFLDQITGMIRPQAEAKGLDFQLIRDPALPQYVRSDERRLRQILVNLLSNAVKYTAEGRVTLDIQYRNQVATFTVSDTGYGIPADDLPVIFEPFQRGSGDQSRLAPGLGLGLTITRLLTQTLGGEITVESAPGEGTVFKVRLMLYGLDRPAAVTDRKILTYTGPRRTIMVVDDNEEHRELMREALTPLDFVVLTAASAPECLALIEGARPDIYLVDISMPGMNGWELAARLRTSGQTAPIVMLSANIGDGSSGVPSGSDHNDALAKPVDFRQVHDKLASWLGLEWVYAIAIPENGARTDTAMTSPGASHVQELIRLGEIGYVRGIEAKLNDLAKHDENRHFAEVMTAHIKAFNIDAYLADLRKLERQGGNAMNAAQEPRDIILLVDDSPESLSFLTDALEQSGYSVLIATSGASALSIVDRITPDLILLDAVMPAMDGFETCTRLKALSGVAQVPVIFMTGLTETEHVVRALEAGGVDYLTKPINIDELRARIRVHLANARSAQSARVALDAAGRHLLAVRANGKIRWSTPQATRLVNAATGSDEGLELVSASVSAWMGDHKSSANLKDPSFTVETGGEATLSLSFLGSIGQDEHLFRLTSQTQASDGERLRQHFSLTARESEVLAWIAKGKSNRDIAEILGLSARTVNKHLEQIYVKLGVENRASAAVKAANILMQS